MPHSYPLREQEALLAAAGQEETVQAEEQLGKLIRKYSHGQDTLVILVDLMESMS